MINSIPKKGDRSLRCDNQKSGSKPAEYIKLNLLFPPTNV